MNPSQRRARALPGLTPIAAAVSTLWLGMAGAQAQQASDTVVVTGIRHAVETSIQTKRDNDSIVEAVTAEDIGKLPDNSIAESLARLPGLAMERVNGRAAKITIRGLGGNYAATLLNGREVVSTSDNRDAEFDQFPSELLGSAVVYKTSDAAIMGQGLSGSVDMRVVRPLDFRSRQVVVGLRGEKNSNGAVASGGPGDKGSRFALSYIDQFADRTLGVALGYAHLDSPGQDKTYKSWWWGNTGNWGRAVQGAPDGAITLNGFEATVTSSKQKRDGLMGVLEWKPSKELHSTVDLFYSKFDQKRNYRALMTNLGPTWNDATEPVWTNPSTSLVNGDTILTGGTVGNLKPVIRGDYNTRDDKISAIGWNTEVKAAGWTGTADLAWSKARRKEQILETYAGTLNPGSLQASIVTGFDGTSTFTPVTYDYADPSVVLLSDPAGWGHDGLVKYPKITDTVKSLRLSAKRDFEWLFLSSVDFGANQTRRTKDVHKDEFTANLKNGRTPIAVPANLLLAPTPLDQSGIPGILSWDVMGAFNTLYDIEPTALDQASKRDYDITEKVSTAYLKAGIDGRVGAVPVRGNLGLQVVHATQHSNGLLSNGAVATPIEGGASYTDVLPSLNLIFELDRDLLLRFGASRTMARPRMEDMRAGLFNVGVDATTHIWHAEGGNAKLEPWRAEAYDLSLERYFGKASYVALAAFHKHLKNFIYTKDVVFDFSGFTNPGNTVPVSNLGILSAPDNAQGGKVEGLELMGSLDAGQVTPLLDGFGLSASFARNRSSLHEGGNLTNPLDGLSHRINTVTLWYEKYGFSARVAQRSRSEFVSYTRGVFLDSQVSRIEPERQVDVQLGYSFDSGALKGLSLLFQVNNATNEPYRTRVGVSTGSANANATLPEKYETYGRVYLLGATYKF